MSAGGAPAHERSEGATRTERGVGVPASERVRGSGGAKPPGSEIERKLRPVEVVR
jgi:hypothetical protein